ncbi:transient receptor potential cation channel, subfamily N, member 1 isoform X2 [Polypterus senegalus]|uniref:transient receptor potential cation channel, subfamily N, member 1 isoform X2 n=1 Tax=Polypterus senegalus TaxID=55291 RepID=UPI0019650CB2|nr:transient receptor potential cation channel, subfamily N, member 1 isoform X2 [Polypterus senegalus]
MSEGGSLSSGSVVKSVHRVVQLAGRGDWIALEQTLKSMDKGDPEISQTGEDGRNALHIAATHSKEEIVKLLVKKIDPNLPGGPKNQLPLHYAAVRSSGAQNIIQTLLKYSSKEARLVQDEDGCIPLILSVEAGNVAVCKELLSAMPVAQLRAQRKGNGDTALHACCRKKDVELAKLLVEYGANVDFQNDEGQTSLHVAAWEGDEAMLKYFYQCKANPNIVDKLDRSPLHIAAERGHTNIVEVLTEKFKSNVLSRTKDGSTLMHIASQCGHPETALTFLKKGVPLHMPDKSGAVCLHAAAKRGHTAVVKALLQKGAHVDAITKDGYTALHIAVQYCKPLVVQTLLGFGAQVQLKGGKAQETPLHIAAHVKEGEKVAEMLLKSGADVNAEQENGETAMHIAARYGNLKMMQALIEEGGDVTSQSKAGENPLHIAVRHCHAHVVEEILTYLASEKSLMEAVVCVNQENKEGETPLHLAAEIKKDMIHFEHEDIKIIEILMEYDVDITAATKLTWETPLHYSARVGNADVLLEMLKNFRSHQLQQVINKQAKNGWSPLLMAAERGHTEIVKILLQNHARVDVFDEHGKAALHLAAENGNKEIADILLQHKAFVNAKTKLGLTPLHLAAQNGYNRLVKLLVETHMASIDVLSLTKRTPLHVAALSGQLDVCSTLLNIKADINATDIHGQTPLHLAAENDHSEVVKLFLKHKPELATTANEEGSTCAHIAASKGSVAVIKELLKFNKNGVTSARNKTNDSSPLHLAAAGGHTDVVKVLLEAGASASEENAEGMTAVHLAAKYGHINVLDALKGTMSFKIHSTKTGLTALHVAAQFGQVDFVREILTKVPATVQSEVPQSTMEGRLIREHTSESGYTPLHLAAQSGHENLVRLLLNYPGVQADAQTHLQGSTPLHLAAQNGHTAVVGLLLSKSTSHLLLKDKRGRTCLHLAAANGHSQMVRVLLGQGAEINDVDKNGWTPLHFAAKSGFLETVRFLVESGASSKLECKEGKLPIQYAAEENHQETLSFLLRRGSNSLKLIEDRKFIFDLMVCGKMNKNKVIVEFVLHSPAPLNTAVKLSRAFNVTALKEKERSMDLLNAAKCCEGMATELLTVASGGKSAGYILRAVDHRNTSMLDCLIESQQKDVVAHPAVQKYLTEVWYGNLKWATWKIALLFFCFLLCPPVWLIFSLPLRHRFNKIPIIKFMSHLVSHIFLILLFILTIVYPPINPIYLGHMLPAWNEWLLLAWLAGVLVSELTHPGERVGLAWIRVLVLGFSAIGFFCHILAIAFHIPDRLNCLFVRNIFLSISMTLSFMQFLEFLTFHHLFGPWAIIIRDLMKDLARFAVILVLFEIAFTMNLSAIYQPVYPVDTSIENHTSNDNGTKIQTPLEISFKLFFALFGLVDPDSMPPLIRTPAFTKAITNFIFGVYLVVTVIVLINLLIAMMSDTYQRIQAQSDTEWKFGRAMLIRDMNRKSGTPSPFNLFTVLYFYVKTLCKHGGKICCYQGRELMTEEHEDLSHILDNTSLDMLTHTHVGWIRTTKRTQISPEGGFIRPSRQSGLVQIEEVTDWQSVAVRYLSLKGQTDGTLVEKDPPPYEDSLNIQSFGFKRF